MIKKDILSKKELKSKDKSKIKSKEYKSTMMFKEWEDINTELGLQLFSYFYTLIAILYRTHEYNEKDIVKPELIKDIKPCSVGDFIIEFFNLPEKEIKSTILLNTWILSNDNESLPQLLCELATKEGMRISNYKTLTPEEFNSLIDCFYRLMYEAKSRLNFM